MTFKNGKLKGALISGDAQSTYFHVMEKKRQIEGKNEAAGDTIRIAFDDGKVKHLKLSGKKTLASGRYIDLTKENILPQISKDTTIKNFTKQSFGKDKRRKRKTGKTTGAAKGQKRPGQKGRPQMKSLIRTIRTDKICKIYNGRKVVNNVSISVSQGEIVGLLGPNGAGKTTSFYMIVGMVRPDSGHIFWTTWK